MRIILIIAIAVSVLFQNPDPPRAAPEPDEAVSPRLEALKRQIARGDASAVEAFWREVKAQGAPFIESILGDKDHELVSFVYRGNESTTSVTLVSQLSFVRGQVNLLTHLAGTDVWFKTYRLRNDIRLSYGFLPGPVAESLVYRNRNGSGVADPLNPKTVSAQANIGPSVLELLRAPAERWITERPGVAKGELREDMFTSTILKTERRVWIYTPAGFDSKRKDPYPLLICFDGLVYTMPDFIPSPTILDNLIAEKQIPPMVGIFIDQAPQPQRNIELDNNQPFLDFVVDEVLPRLREKFHLTKDPKETLVCGSSSGGVASAFFAFRRPDVFGNVLSQSGAFWPGHTREDPQREWLTGQYESSSRLPVRFVLQVGILEMGNTPNNGPSILETNRHLRDVLQAKGYKVSYYEVAGGHEPISWRGGLVDGLIELLGQRK